MTAPERDRWGRPKIVHPITGKEVGYTRPSTIAKMLSDEFGLRKWVARQTLLGAAKREDIIQLASTLTADDKHKLDDLAEQAQQHAGSSARAQTGTALHAVVEGINRGQESFDVLSSMADDIAAYRALIEAHGIGFDPAWCEPFVINDTHGYGGSPDAYATWDGREVVLDLKTGANIWLPEHAIQLALYANAEHRYHDGERTPLPDLDRTVGLIVHLPAGEARAELWTVDLEAGWEAAQTAMWVHRWRKRKDLGQRVEIAGTASQAAAEAGTTAGSGPEYSTQTPARDPRGQSGGANATAAAPGDPFDGLTPLADAERVAWVRDRIKAFDDSAKQRVAKLWPDDVPAPKTWAEQKPTSAQLDDVVWLLDQIGAEVDEPLTADPAALVANSNYTTAWGARVTRGESVYINEGPDMDTASVDSLRAAVGRLTQDQRDRLNGWVAEAHDAGYPIGLKRDPVPKRRWTIVWALLGLADLDDDDVRAVLYGATSSESALQESIPIGAVLADLTIDEAKLAGDMARAFGTPDLTMTYNETTRLPSFNGPVMGVA